MTAPFINLSDYNDSNFFSTRKNYDKFSESIIRGLHSNPHRYLGTNNFKDIDMIQKADKHVSNISNSTLSLHISTYENFIEAENGNKLHDLTTKISNEVKIKLLFFPDK